MKKLGQLIPFSMLAALCVSLMLGACASSGGSRAAPVTPVVPPTPPPPPPPPVVLNPSDFETTEYLQNYALGTLGASTAYSKGATGEGILVAVIDSGVLSDHSDLIGQISPLSIDIVDQNTPVTDTDGHGTFVAGIIAAAKNDSGVHGIAYNSKILAIRASERSPDNPAVDDCGNDDGGCQFGDTNLAAAVDYAVNNGARIINMSLGGGKFNNAALDAALARAAQAGVIIVAAAGNGYEDTDGDGIPDDLDSLTPDAPGNFAGTAAALGRALAVGATDSNNLIASFSNRAGDGAVQNFFLVAPGVDIISPSLDPDNPTDRNTYFQGSGTSFSTPYVAGALALLLEAFPNLKAEEAVALLVDTATDLGDTGPDATYGRGLVNLKAAFEPNGATSASFGGMRAVKVDMSRLLAAPKGAFGDWASSGGAFKGMVFQDQYERSFKTSAQPLVHTVAKGIGLLEVFADANNYDFDQARIALGKSSTANFGTVALKREKIWTDPYFDTAHLDSPLDALFKQKKRADVDYDLRLHVGKFHIGTGKGRALGTSGRLSPVPNTSGDIYSLVGASSWFSVSYDIARSLRFGFVSHSSDDGQLTALQLDKTVGLHDFTGEIGFLQEDHTVFGSDLMARFGDFDRAKTSYMALNWTGPVREMWQVAVRFEIAQADMYTAEYVDLIKKPIATSWSATLGRPVFGHSYFSLKAYQPLRTESGTIGLDIPIAYNYETQTSSFETRNVNITPSGRELNLKSTLTLPLTNNWNLAIWGHYIHNPYHVAVTPDEQIGWLSLSGNW